MEYNWKGISVCFTGKLNNFTRNEARALAKKKGFIIADGVSSFCDILVVADPNSGSRKLKKAKAMGIRCISEDEFIKMCDKDKAEVEAATEWKKTHKEKKILDWETACKRFCKHLGLKVSVTSEVDQRDYTTRRFYGQIEIPDLTMRGWDKILCTTSNMHFNESDVENYTLTREDAYKRLCWCLGTKIYLKRSADYNFIDKKYTDFGKPESTEEMKLKLEVNDGISIV